MFPDKIYYEEAAMGYELGKYLKQKIFRTKLGFPLTATIK